MADTPRATVPVEPTPLSVCRAIAPYLGAIDQNDWRGLGDDDAISMPVKMRVGDLRDLKAVISAAPAPEGGAVSEVELRDAITLILPLAKGYAAAHPVGSNQSYVDYVENLIATREEAPADRAHPCYDEHQPGCDCVIPAQSTVPMPSYLERLSAPAEAGELKADFTRSHPSGLDDSTYEQIEDALDRADAPINGPDGKFLTLAQRVEALRAQPQAREDALRAKGEELVKALKRYGFPVSGAATVNLGAFGSSEAMAVDFTTREFTKALAALQQEGRP